MQGQQADIKALTLPSIRQLFQQLEKKALKENTWQSESNVIKGLFFLVENQELLEPDLIKLLEIIPASQLSLWTISNLNFIHSTPGLEAKANFFASIQRNPDSPSIVKTLINQLSTL
ncbi:hypothetical protein [Siphonobacter sp. BAB-5405]|uniref:hypothetical protein n=1 Tax=Siphonobacter sp. BAB-5405 TaxID=1864825 RepID=UPI0011AFAC42|nr:hypothetical protein [Siphonobacter sp. BAB-5405]